MAWKVASCLPVGTFYYCRDRLLEEGYVRVTAPDAARHFCPRPVKTLTEAATPPARCYLRANHAALARAALGRRQLVLARAELLLSDPDLINGIHSGFRLNLTREAAKIDAAAVCSRIGGHGTAPIFAPYSRRYALAILRSWP
jgi:hypothetical protein